MLSKTLRLLNWASSMQRCRAKVTSTKVKTASFSTTPHNDYKIVNTLIGGGKEEKRKENQKRRIELATAYRALHELQMNEGTCNHLTAMAPWVHGEGMVMLLVPRGMLWSEVTPQCLVGLDANDNVVEGSGVPELTAMCIHKGLRTNHPHNAIMHTHSPYLTALGCLSEPELLMIHQNCGRFWNKIAYDFDFGGAGNNEAETVRLGKVLGDKHVLFMGNHGIAATGDNVAMAFDRIYYIERLAMFQILAMSTGKKLSIISDEVLQRDQKYYEEQIHEYADDHLTAWIRHFSQTSKDFEEYFFL